MVQVPKHVYWSTRGTMNVDLRDEAQRKWWIKQVLLNGTMDDVRGLDLQETERLLPELHLPTPVRSLWRDYFERRRRSESLSA